MNTNDYYNHLNRVWCASYDFVKSIVRISPLYGRDFSKIFTDIVRGGLNMLHDMKYLSDDLYLRSRDIQFYKRVGHDVILHLGEFRQIHFPAHASIDQVLKILVYTFDLVSV